MGNCFFWIVTCFEDFVYNLFRDVHFCHDQLLVFFLKKCFWNSNLLPMLRLFEDVLPLFFLASIFEYGFDFAETLAYAKMIGTTFSHIF